ncbi:MAG: helix-turn-helix domain-containing protein [Rhodocyclaceae bacterium]|nr:helix-turn-helix domain-containing protein [Rhodocyclaceae bacterium]MDZ4214545.1 helix-turn-helix domain-containing protein [Rhodocyclaceae bacterium]
MTYDNENIDWQSIGRQFRQQREAVGTPVETVARQLCLVKPQILALEAGLATNFPGAPARLWCAQRYATLLGIDLDAIAPLATASDSPEVAVRNAPTVLDSALSDSESLARTPSSTMGRGHWAVVLLFLALAAVLAIQFYHPSAPVPTQPRPATISEAPSPAAPVAAPAPVAIPVAPIEEPKPEPVRKVVDVQGLEAHKPARSIYVMAHDAAVLIKQRDGRETDTIRLEKGGSERIPMVAGERLRVAEGKNLGIFFQGRKVPANTIEAGNWMRFVPLR